MELIHYADAVDFVIKLANYKERASKNALLRQIVPSTNEIYEKDFPRVIVLKGSSLLLLQSSLDIASYQQKVSKRAVLKDFVQSINKRYQGSFSEVVVLKRSTKITISSYLRRLPYIKLTTSKNQKYNV